MSRISRTMLAIDARNQTAAFEEAVPSHMAAGERVQEWVFGRTWPNEAARVGSLVVFSAGAVGGAIAGALTNRATPRFIVLTNRRLICFVSERSELTPEWDAPLTAVTSMNLRRVVMGSELIVPHGNDGMETRLHVDGPFRKRAKSLEALLATAANVSR